MFTNENPCFYNIIFEVFLAFIQCVTKYARGDSTKGIKNIKIKYNSKHSLQGNLKVIPKSINSCGKRKIFVARKSKLNSFISRD